MAMILGAVEAQRGVPVPTPGFTMPAARHWRMRFPTTRAYSTLLKVHELELLAATGGPDLATGGTASASSETAPYTAAEAFDGVVNASSDYWSTSSGVANTAGSWLAYDLGAGNDAAVNVIRPYVLGLNTYFPGAWVVQQSADGAAWEDVAAFITPSWTNDAWAEQDISDGLPDAYVCDGRLWTGTAGTTASFTGVNLGPDRADRLVIVALVPTLTTTGSRQVTGVTIAGTAASRVIGLTGAVVTPVEIWAARVTGTSGTVEVTTDANFDRLALAVINGVASSSTAHDTAAATTEAVFDVPAGGFAVAILGQRNNNTNAPFGLSDSAPAPMESIVMVPGTYNAARVGVQTVTAAETKTLAPYVPIAAASWAA